MSDNEQTFSPADEAAPAQCEPLVPGWDESADPGVAQTGSEEARSAESLPTEPEIENPSVIPESGPSGVISPLKVGFFYLLTLLTAGIGCGLVSYHLMGGQIASLTQFERLVEMPASVQMMLLIAAGGLVLLTVLGTAAISRAVSNARNHQNQIRSILAGLANMDLADDESWQDVEYAGESHLASLVNSLRGQYNELRTKHARQISLEGEILRLEKSLVNGERIDLTADYDHPVTSRLADETLRLFDERLQARKRIEDLNSQLDLNGREMCDAVQSALHWNEKSLGQLSNQQQSLEGFASRLTNLLQDASDADLAGGGATQTQTVLAAISEELAKLPTANLNRTLRGLGLLVKELEERGSKLGMRLALEVARLGPAGQPLLPMTEELKSLTGDISTVAWQWDKITEEQQTISMALVEVREDLIAVLQPDDQENAQHDLPRKIVAEIEDILPALRENVASIGAFSEAFELQNDRLQKLGMACSDLTGVEFAAPSPGVNAGGSLESLAVERFDPFGKPVPSADAPADDPVEQKAEPVAEPVSNEAVPTEEVSTQPAVPSSTAPRPGLVTPEEPSISPLAASSEPLPGEPLCIEEPSQPEAPCEFEKSGAPSDAAADLPLGQDDDRVYDLSEFGAVPVTEEAAAETETPDRIYDLAEFGAVALS